MIDLAHVKVERLGDIVIAKICGEVDLSNAGDIATDLHAAFDNTARRAVVDLSETMYLDSIGIRLLFSLAESLAVRRQELHVIVPYDSLLLRLLELVNIRRVVHMHADRGSAIALTD
jgi:anti-anti-sigma factor